MDLLWGWLVVVAALGVVAPAVWWWGLKWDARLLSEDEAMWPKPTAETEPETEAEPLIVDVRPIEDTAEVTDLLGTWRPMDYELEQPLILGHVMLAGDWTGLKPADVGLVAA